MSYHIHQHKDSTRTAKDLTLPQLGTGMVIFTGNVYPERVDFNFFDNREFIMEDKNGASKIKLNLSIVLSQIRVNVTYENFDDNIFTLRNAIQSFLDKIINSFCLGPSFFYKFHLNGVSQPFPSEPFIFPVQENLFEGETPPEIPGSIYEAVLQCSGLALAINDYRDALAKPELTAAYCYRALEAIANTLVEDFNDKNKWKLFDAALKVSKSSRQKYDAIAQSMRHGKILPQSWENRKDQLKITRESIRRYILFIENGKRPLELEDF